MLFELFFMFISFHLILCVFMFICFCNFGLFRFLFMIVPFSCVFKRSVLFSQFVMVSFRFYLCFVFATSTLFFDCCVSFWLVLFQYCFVSFSFVSFLFAAAKEATVHNLGIFYLLARQRKEIEMSRS